MQIGLMTEEWADMPLNKLAAKARSWGYETLELSWGGGHFDVDRALSEDGYIGRQRALLDNQGLECRVISAHWVSQCVCEHFLDERHRAILPAKIWGNGDPEGVRRRAAEGVKDAARAAAAFGAEVVTGFTGSSIWHLFGGFPPDPGGMVDAGFRDFADRWNPIMDVFEEVGVRFALEVHPGEIAYDYWTTERTLKAISDRPTFGINLDPSHLLWQLVDPVRFALRFGDRIYNVHVKDVVCTHDGVNGALSSHLPFGDFRRGWDFVSAGRGSVDFERLFRALNAIGYSGPISVEWEDSGMEREAGAREAAAFVRATMVEPSSRTF